MGEALTIQDINSRYASEWVLVEDPQLDRSLNVQAGRVRFHSKDRDEVYRKAVELRPIRFAMLYTVRMPENTAVIL